MDYVTYLAIAFIIVGVVLVVLPPVIIAFLRWRSSPGPVDGSAAGVFKAEQKRAGLSDDAASRAYVGQRIGGFTQDEALRTFAGSSADHGIDSYVPLGGACSQGGKPARMW
jgi:hypothetical protein